MARLRLWFKTAWLFLWEGFRVVTRFLFRR